MFNNRRVGGGQSSATSDWVNRDMSRNQIDTLATAISRREWLFRSANGFGGLALLAILSDAALGSTAPSSRSTDPLRVRTPHHPARVKSVIFLFMDGGPSQMDTFDPKPRLNREHLQPISMKTPTTVFNISNKVLASPFEFKQHGECGAPVSELFPYVATCVDDLTIVRSLVADHSEHTAANYSMHTGSGFQGRPSVGSWVTNGLGSESRNLPGFIVLENGLIPPGGVDVFGNGFLPASYQGTVFRAGKHPVADLEPAESAPDLQRRKLDLLGTLNRDAMDRLGPNTQLEATSAN